MNGSTKSKQLRSVVFTAGILGALLRTLLYLSGTDEKGLLQSGHWTYYALLALCVAVGAVILLTCRTLTGPKKYARAFPTSVAGAIGCLLCALGFVSAAMADRQHLESTIDLAAMVMSYVSAAALVYIGICRALRAKPYFIAHAALCVCFAMRMVCQYRLWSADPQLMDYLFVMLALICLMLTSYQFAAFDAEMGSHRALWVLGLLSVFFSLVGLYGAREPLFSALCAVWVLTNLTNLRRRRVRPKLVLDDAPTQGA